MTRARPEAKQFILAQVEGHVEARQDLRVVARDIDRLECAAIQRFEAPARRVGIDRAHADVAAERQRTFGPREARHEVAFEHRFVDDPLAARHDRIGIHVDAAIGRFDEIRPVAVQQRRNFELPDAVAREHFRGKRRGDRRKELLAPEERLLALRRAHAETDRFQLAVELARHVEAPGHQFVLEVIRPVALSRHDSRGRTGWSDRPGPSS